MAALAKAIALHLKKKGISQRTVAGRCPLSYEQVNEIARGQGNPTFETLVKLCEGMDTPVGELMTSMDDLRDAREPS